jgi:L-ascorbate metabolism protein UlaG (beta-lactamase superfamily)
MRKLTRIGLGVLLMSAVIVGASSISGSSEQKVEVNVENSRGALQEKGKFINNETRYNPSMSNMWAIIKEQFTAKRDAAKPTEAVPLQVVSREELDNSTEDALVRLGHSTILMRLDGQYVMTDPVFSDRASPVQWAGPKRFHPSPISIEDLPHIKVVVISHDHYDHLDKAAIKQLIDKVDHFVTPLKVGDILIDWGVDEAKVTQLDWWQSKQVDDLNLVATPAQHFSGRGLTNRDETLWASWVIQSSSKNLFFSGDGGYFSGFKEIGDKYGPFDVTMIETGAYNELWADIHMMPEHSMQAHLDLKGKAMLPIHNGTFDLSMHDWFDPFEQITALAEKHNVNVLTPIFGQSIDLSHPLSRTAWWKESQANTETKLAMGQ